MTPEDLAECKRWLEKRYGSVEAAHWYYDEWEALKDTGELTDEEEQDDYRNGYPPSA